MYLDTVQKLWKKGIVYVLVVVYNSDIQIGDLFMKRLIKGLLAMTTLLLSSCGGKDYSVTRKLRCSYYWFNDVDLNVNCRLIREDFEEIEWKGFVEHWLIQIGTSVTYWYELSNGEHALKVGIK